MALIPSTQNIAPNNRMMNHPPVELVPVRLSKQEAFYFNAIQGGQFIDPKTKLRDYSRLSIVFKKDPELKTLFEAFAKITRHHDGKIPKDLEHEIVHLSQDSKNWLTSIPSDFNPQIKAINSHGTGDDKLLVMMPSDVAGFLTAIEPRVETDPVEGVVEFGWFNEIVRGVATVGGFLAGGPFGAGAGRALSHVLTGGKLKDALGHGAKTFGMGALASGLGGLAGLKGSQFAGPLSTMGMGKSLLGGLGLGNALGMSNPAASATPGVDAASNAAAKPGFLSGMGLPAALLGGSFLLQHHGKKQEEKENERRHKESMHHYERDRRALGIDEPTADISGIGSHYFKRREHTPPKLYTQPAFKKGGDVTSELVTGPGKGQDDLINNDKTRAGDWIWHASITSAVGDGTTDAGYKEILKFEKMLKKDPKFKKTPFTKTPIVKTALSNGEVITPAKIVNFMGDGNLDKGIKILRTLTKDIMSYKTSKGSALPPAIGSIHHFYDHAKRKVG